MSALALLLDRQTEDELVVEAIEHGHRIVGRAADAAAMIELLSATPVEVVVTGGDHARLTAALLERCDAHGVRVVVVADGPVQRRNAAELGLHEVVPAGSRWAAVEAMLTARPTPVEPVGGPASSQATPAGRGVYAVWGPAGAPGRSTLAIAIAAEFAASGRSVVLADVDSYGGTIAPALGLLDEAPGFAAACRLAAASGLSVDELERVAQLHGVDNSDRTAAFHVLTGISRSARWPELVPSRVTAVLEACAMWREAVVVDVGFSLESDEEISSDLYAPRRNGATIAALRAARHVVAVGSADPIGLPRFLRGYADLLEVVDAAAVSVVINRVRSGSVGFDGAAQVRAAIKRFGGIEHAHLVPDDPRAYDAALRAASSVQAAAPRSDAAAAVATFVAEALLPSAPERRRRRFATARGIGSRYAGRRVDAQ